MSADYSHYERDHFRRSNRRQEYRTSFTYAQRVYEPKSSDKNLNNHEQENSYQNHNDHDHDNYDNYDNYDNHNSRSDRYNNYSSRDNRYNNYGSYRQRGYQKERRDVNHRIGYWIKEAVPVNKENTSEKQEKTPVKESKEYLVSENCVVYVKKEQSPVNKAVIKLDEDQVEDGKICNVSSGSLAIASGSNSTDSSENKKDEGIFDSPPRKSDNLQIIEEKETNRSDDEKDKVKNMTTNEKVEDREREKTFGGNNCEEKDQQPSLPEKTEVKEDVFEDKNVKINDQNTEREEKESEETDESDGEKYSNIDELMEKKLMNNEFGEEEQLFDDLGNEIKKEDVDALVDEERPVWEDLDTKKVLEDIQHEEYLFMLPQNIRSWANKEWENIGNKQNENAPITNKSPKVENMITFDFNDDEEFDQIFSSRKFERGFSRPTLEIVPVPSMSNSGFDAYIKDYCGTAAVHTNPATIESANSDLLGPKSANLPVFRSHHVHTPYISHQGDYDAHIHSSHLPQSNGFDDGISRSGLTPNQGNFSNLEFPKFVFKRFSRDYDAHIWFYVDAYETIQGPFSGRVMDDWLGRGCLPLDLRVSMENGTKFRSLNELAEFFARELSQSFNINENDMNQNNFYASGSSRARAQSASFSLQERQTMTAFQNQQPYHTNGNLRKSSLPSQGMPDIYIPFESLPNQCQPLVKDNRSPEGIDSPVLNVVAFEREDSRPKGLRIPKNYNKSRFDENYNNNVPESSYQEDRQKNSPLSLRNSNCLFSNSDVNNTFIPTIPKRNSPQISTLIHASAPNTPFTNVASATKLTQPFTQTYQLQPTNCVSIDQLQEYAWKAVINDDDDFVGTEEVSQTH